MDQLIRILNDDDRKALDWLRTHAGDVRVAAAARRLGVPANLICPLCAAISVYGRPRHAANAGLIMTARWVTGTWPRFGNCLHSVPQRQRNTAFETITAIHLPTDLPS